MPITFAHPAAVLPLVRRLGKGGWVAGLVVGSMVPDLMQTWWPTRLPHSIPGLFLLDTPVAFLLGWAMHALLRSRLGSLPGWKWEVPGSFHGLWAVLGAWIGGVTHLVWDLFTHADSVPVVRFLMHHQEALTSIGFSQAGPVRFLHALWYLNSVVGLCGIAFFAWSWIRGRTSEVSRLPWKPLALAAATPFLPLLVEVPACLAVESGTFLQRLGKLSTTLRMDTLLSPLLALVVFVALTGGRLLPQPSERRGP